MRKSIIHGTLLSVLIFFTISFITVLFQIQSPLNRDSVVLEFEIGFPFVYYQEFLMDCTSLHAGWYPLNLLWDCAIIWVLTVGFYEVLRRKRIIKNG